MLSEPERRRAVRDLSTRYETLTRDAFSKLFALLDSSTPNIAAIKASVPALRAYELLQAVCAVAPDGSVRLDDGRLEDAADAFAARAVERGWAKALAKIGGTRDAMLVSSWDYDTYTVTALVYEYHGWLEVVQTIKVKFDGEYGVTVVYGHRILLNRRPVTERELRRIAAG